MSKYWFIFALIGVILIELAEVAVALKTVDELEAEVAHLRKRIKSLLNTTDGIITDLAELEDEHESNDI